MTKNGIEFDHPASIDVTDPDSREKAVPTREGGYELDSDPEIVDRTAEGPNALELSAIGSRGVEHSVTLELDAF